MSNSYCLEVYSSNPNRCWPPQTRLVVKESKLLLMYLKLLISLYSVSFSFSAPFLSIYLLTATQIENVMKSSLFLVITSILDPSDAANSLIKR